MWLWPDVVVTNTKKKKKGKEKQCEIEKYQDLFILNTLIDDDDEEEISFDK